MSNVQRITVAVSAFLLALLDFAAGMGVHLPTGVDAQGVTLLNGAISALAAVVLHLMGKDQSAQPPAA